MSNAYWEPLDFELSPVPDTAVSGWERRIDMAREAPEDIIDPPAEQVVIGAGIAWRGVVRGAACAHRKPLRPRRWRPRTKCRNKRREPIAPHPIRTGRKTPAG
jgi:hypothetical protein